jgi:glycosyltransferase involved in cell wall biosynthesis
VLLPARLLREKGIYEFAAAAAEVLRAGVGARFVVAGRLDPANPGALTLRELQSLSANSPVEWVGDSRDMPRLMRDASIVCLPSYYREGVPRVLLEACAAGRAVVTTNTPGCRDIVHHEKNGLLVPPRDVAALAAAIGRLLASPEMRRRMGTAGRLRAEREFDVGRVVQAHLELYRELVPRRTPVVRHGE